MHSIHIHNSSYSNIGRLKSVRKIISTSIDPRFVRNMKKCSISRRLVQKWGQTNLFQQKNLGTIFHNKIVEIEVLKFNQLKQVKNLTSTRKYMLPHAGFGYAPVQVTTYPNSKTCEITYKTWWNTRPHAQLSSAVLTDPSSTRLSWTEY